MFALSSSKRTLFAAIFAAALLSIAYIAAAQDSDADDPPAEAGRISYVSGNVSIQPVTSDQWGQAYPNLPLGPGDRIFTDNDGRAEIQIGRTYVRIGPNSDVTLVDDSQFNINFGVAQGSVRLHSFGLWPRQLVDISTPNGNAEFAQQGDLRIDVLPSDGATVFTNLGQFADITAAGNYRQELDYGQSLEVAGSNPVYPQWLQPAGPDDLDAWSQDRDQRMASVASYNYVSPDIEGAADLDSSGDWQPQTDYGAMWFPRNVPADWEPYHNGHWINRDPWGWVWIEDESWGYAPFHYGRWARYNNRWGWVPGPVNVRPVWSPALVVFAGGGGGGGLSVWFPLGPGEAYRPWYRCSPRYIDRVNITNIREAPRVHVERSYVNIVNVTNVTNVTYVNRTYVTAMHQNDFASGRQVRDVAVRVDPREMQQMRPLARPEVAAPSRPIISRPVAHPVPVSVQRPMLINQQGKQIVARPGAAPVAPPVRTAPPVKPLPGRAVVAAPAHPVPNRPGFPNQSPAAQGNNQYERPNNQPNQPGQAYPGGTPRANPVGVAPGGERNLNSQPGNQPGVNQNQRPVEPTGRPVPPTYQQQERPNQPSVQQPNQPNYQQPRPNLPNQPTSQQPSQPNPQQPQRPNYQQPNEQQRPNEPNQPNYQQQPRPNQPNYQQPPRANQPQTPPPVRRQDFGPVQPDKHQDQPPTPPNGNPNQGRPVQPQPQDRQITPPPRPNYQPQDRPAPPNRTADQPRPNQQVRPQQNDKQNNKQNNKDQKKDDKDKKDDKKHD